MIDENIQVEINTMKNPTALEISMTLQMWLQRPFVFQKAIHIDFLQE